jgi:hypothetical protein
MPSADTTDCQLKQKLFFVCAQVNDAECPSSPQVGVETFSMNLDSSQRLRPGQEVRYTVQLHVSFKQVNPARTYWHRMQMKVAFTVLQTGHIIFSTREFEFNIGRSIITGQFLGVVIDEWESVGSGRQTKMVCYVHTTESSHDAPPQEAALYSHADVVEMMVQLLEAVSYYDHTIMYYYPNTRTDCATDVYAL